MWSTYLTSTESGHQYPGSASPEPSVSVNLLVAAQPQPAHHIPTSLHEPQRLVDGRSPRVGLSSRLLTRTCRLPCFSLPTSLILFFIRQHPLPLFVGQLPLALSPVRCCLHPLHARRYDLPTRAAFRSFCLTPRLYTLLFVRHVTAAQGL